MDGNDFKVSSLGEAYYAFFKDCFLLLLIDKWMLLWYKTMTVWKGMFNTNLHL